MLYAGSVRSGYVYSVFRHNFAPVFYIDGRPILGLVAREYGDGYADFDPVFRVEERRRADVNVFHRSGDSGADVIYLLYKKDLVRRTGLRPEMSVGVSPVRGGVRLVWGAGPDPGEEPPVSPVEVHVFRFRRVRRLDEAGTIYVFLGSVRDMVSRHGYMGVSHVGGSMFLFVDDPFKYRLPFFRIAWRAEQVPVIVLSTVVARQMGLPDELGCFLVVRDVEGRHYVKLLRPGECRGR